MQRRRHDGDDFFGLGNSFAGLSVLGRRGSLRSDFLGRRSTLGDAFFSRSFGDGPSFVPGGSRFGHQLSLSVTYGGPNGAYYASSTVIVEESKEADGTNGKATHRISRGIGHKVCILTILVVLLMGYTVARKLSVDGRVDMSQTFHNLNEGLFIQHHWVIVFSFLFWYVTSYLQFAFPQMNYLALRKLGRRALNTTCLDGTLDMVGSEKSSSAMGWTPVRSSASTNFPRIQSSV
ncbi:hypothetical protein GW17_00027136 [Ensete ventricosum]|nr:hypothetical protein GW17_00027136 [Ensete ventricosum]